MMRCFALAPLLLLAACLAGQAQTYNLSFGSLSASPVVVTELTINGNAFGMVPQLVDARSDEVKPRANSGSFSMQYPAAQGGEVSVDVVWIEAMTGRAFTAKTAFAFADLEKDQAGSVYFAPIFGPNGLMVITSDPVPTSPTDQPVRDLVQVCGQRAPGRDVDYRAAPDSLPDLAAVLADARPAASVTECTSGER